MVQIATNAVVMTARLPEQCCYSKVVDVARFATTVAVEAVAMAAAVATVRGQHC